jgi:broad specificity phosphatase PhoE
MEITFIRHGRSKHIENHKMPCFDFTQWVENYDNNGVFEELTYPSATIEKITSAKIVVTSDLIRAVESAQLLKPGVKVISNPVFRETELPRWAMKSLKLRPNVWAVLLRILWLCGYSNECESLTSAKLRAEKAAQQLMTLAEENKSVALVGHGVFNRLIAKELQKQGWKGKRRTTAKHWNCTSYYLDC